MTDTPNFRALCAELYQEFSSLYGDMSACVDFNDSYMERIDNLCNRADAALATVPPDPSQLSDGYHTFEELYEHRHALTLSLMKARPDLFWFSRRHNDGELCFGDGNWFIVGAELPGAGAITYHLPMRLWEAATHTGATELEIGKPWDGHTATDVVDRLMAWAITPPPEPVREGPSIDDIRHLCVDNELLMFVDSGDFDTVVVAILEIVCAALARWGRTATPPPEPPQPPTDEEIRDNLEQVRAALERWGHR